MMEVETKENEETEENNPREVLEAWIADQDEKVQSMFKDGIAGLTSALQKEREAAKEAARLKRELAEATQKLDNYKTDEEKAIDALNAKVETLETEKAEAVKTAEEAKKKLIERTISFTVTAEALKMGFEDPSDAESLLPADSVTYDEETGNVKGAKAALKKLAETKPYLLGKGDGVGTPRGSSTSKVGKKDEIAPPTGLRF